MTDLFKKAQSYVGTPYLVGEFDCADLAVKVQLELWGRAIALPLRRKRPGGVLGQAREIHRLQDDLATLVEEPDNGDGVLMHDGGAPPTWHIGTVFLHEGEAWVLHNSFTLGSAALQRLADLRRFGLKVEGFYAWRAAT